jgi:hypothetical protein
MGDEIINCHCLTCTFASNLVAAMKHVVLGLTLALIVASLRADGAT